MNRLTRQGNLGLVVVMRCRRFQILRKILKQTKNLKSDEKFGYKNSIMNLDIVTLTKIQYGKSYLLKTEVIFSLPLAYLRQNH